MRVLKQIIATVVMLCVLALGVMAEEPQKDPKGPPPKPPQQVQPGQKPPPPPREPKGGNDNRRGKP